MLWDELGVPTIDDSRLEGPSRCMEFLGIEVDIELLSRDKMERLL